jgi:hypothetical protein
MGGRNQLAEMRRKRCDGERLRNRRRQLWGRQMGCGRERAHMIVVLVAGRIV